MKTLIKSLAFSFFFSILFVYASNAQELKLKSQAIEEEKIAKSQTEFVGVTGVSSDLVIRQGDRLKIYIHPELDPDDQWYQKERIHYVDNRGYIFIAPIGKIKVIDMTLQQLEDLLTNKIKDTIAKTPLVFVSKETNINNTQWKEAYVRSIPVFGEVGGPGNVYAVREDFTLLETISEKGSFKESADLRNVKIVRIVDGKEKVFTLNAGDIMEGKSPDVVMERGDVVFVPKEKEEVIYMFGEVNRTGPIRIREFFGDRIKMVEAISLAGGFTIWAAENNVKLIRIVDGKRTVQKIKVRKIIEGEAEDVILLPGDVVVVPESWW